MDTVMSLVCPALVSTKAPLWDVIICIQRRHNPFFTSLASNTGAPKLTRRIFHLLNSVSLLTWIASTQKTSRAFS